MRESTLFVLENMRQINNVVFDSVSAEIENKNFIEKVHYFLKTNESTIRPVVQAISNGTLVGTGLFFLDARRYAQIAGFSSIGKVLHGSVAKQFVTYQKRAYLTSTAGSQREHVNKMMSSEASDKLESCGQSYELSESTSSALKNHTQFFLPPILVGGFTGVLTNYHYKCELLLRAKYEITMLTFAQKIQIAKLGLLTHTNRNIVTASLLSTYDFTKNHLEQILPVEQYDKTAATLAAIGLGVANGVLSNVATVCDINYRINKVDLNKMNMPGFTTAISSLLKTEGWRGAFKGSWMATGMSAGAFLMVMLSEEKVVPYIFADGARKKEKVSIANKARLFQSGVIESVDAVPVSRAETNTSPTSLSKRV